jgi:hypothetical protein
MYIGEHCWAVCVSYGWGFPPVGALHSFLVIAMALGISNISTIFMGVKTAIV